MTGEILRVNMVPFSGTAEQGIINVFRLDFWLSATSKSQIIQSSARTIL